MLVNHGVQLNLCIAFWNSITIISGSKCILPWTGLILRSIINVGNVEAKMWAYLSV